MIVSSSVSLCVVYVTYKAHIDDGYRLTKSPKIFKKCLLASNAATSIFENPNGNINLLSSLQEFHP